VPSITSFGFIASGAKDYNYQILADHYCIGLGIVYIHLVGTRIFTETWFRLDFSKVVGSIPRWSSIIITNITFTYIVVFIRFWTCILFTSISRPLLWFCFCRVGLMLTYLAHFFLFVRYIPVSHYWKICIGIINDSCWIDVLTTCTELTDTDIVIPAQHTIPMFIGRARIKVFQVWTEYWNCITVPTYTAYCQ
jgi:hypothetical protein